MPHRTRMLRRGLCVGGEGEGVTSWWVGGGGRCTRGKRGGPRVWLRSSRGLWAVGQMGGAGTKWGTKRPTRLWRGARSRRQASREDHFGPGGARCSTVSQTPLRRPKYLSRTRRRDSNTRHRCGPCLRSRQRPRKRIGANESPRHPLRVSVCAPGGAHADAARSAIFSRVDDCEGRHSGVSGRSQESGL